MCVLSGVCHGLCGIKYCEVRLVCDGRRGEERDRKGRKELL